MIENKIMRSSRTKSQSNNKNTSEKYEVSTGFDKMILTMKQEMLLKSSSASRAGAGKLGRGKEIKRDWYN